MKFLIKKKLIRTVYITTYVEADSAIDAIKKSDNITFAYHNDMKTLTEETGPHLVSVHVAHKDNEAELKLIAHESKSGIY